MEGIPQNSAASQTPVGDRDLPSVAIVILNWNGKEFLEKFLPSVLASTYMNKRVVIADNASTDDSVAFLKLHYPLIEIIQNESNEGFAGGYNSALKKVFADYYVLLNSDVKVKEDWIEPVIQLMQMDQQIAACQPKILAYNNPDYFEYAGAAGGWIDHFGYPFSRGRVFEVCEKDNGQYDRAQPCFWATGAALFIRSALFHEMGGFDRYFFAHQEEIDLCWRLQLAGYRIFVQPASVVFHVGGGTLPKGNSRKTFLNFRNNLVMLYKNLPLKSKVWKIPVRLMLDGIAAWKNLLTGDIGFWKAVAKAHFHFVKWIFFEKHPGLKAKKPKARLEGVYPGSIVWDHFIKKKNIFSEIIGSK